MMMKKVSYYLLYGCVYLVSRLPFRLLYLLSDTVYALAFHVVRYRRRIVWQNLSSSFPEKEEKELRQIEKEFYHWFCDYIFETFKLLTVSHGQLLRHIEFRGVEAMEECFDRGQNCAAILGHYGNWEWLSATGLAFRRHPDAVMGLIYHPLYNEAFNRLFIDIRSAQKGVCIPKMDILRHLIIYKRENRRSLFGYISDQAPKWENIHLWLPFLNHDTPVFTGGERIMRKMDDAVFYADMERPRRGQYICTFRPIAAHAAATREFDITTRFFQMLEASVRNQPAIYLWTHNRWKRTHEEFDRKYDVINGKSIRKEGV